ncbi:MAG: response regulator [SAR324 cluster bacterium]|nr:response regulator [SAR324 cluster bacterium]
MKPYRIIYADDEQVFQDLLQAVFEPEMDLELITVSSAAEAWIKLQSKEVEYELIIVDRQMPGISGDEFVKSIRSERDFYTGIPIIMFTSKESTEDFIRGMELGVDYYIPKSLDHSVLIQYAKSAAEKYRRSSSERQQYKKADLSRHNKDVYVDYMVGSSNYDEPELLVQLFFDSIKKFTFDNWEALEVSILLKQDDLEIGRSSKTADANLLSRLDKAILERTLREYYIETTSDHESEAVFTGWAILWDMENETENTDGLAVLVSNYPSLNTSDPTVLAERKQLRDEIEEVVAKLLERFSELMQKLSARKKLEEANIQLQEQKEALEKEKSHTKKIVLFSTKEFQQIADDNDKNQEKQVELWEKAVQFVSDSFAEAQKIQEGDEGPELQVLLWKNAMEAMNDSFNLALELFLKLQPNQQLLLNNLMKLKGLYDQAAVNENLVPGQMSDKNKNEQQNVDDLLSSFGM